ncbi:hypothetical protein KAJ27_08575 [bacterium]|nr:hypothetical protein [bacterium]
MMNTLIANSLNNRTSLEMQRHEKIQNLKNEDIQRDIQLKEKAQELESLFLTQLLKVMEGTIPGKGLGGSDNNLASMMFSNIMADSISEQGGMGLSDMLYTSLREKDGKIDMPEMDNNMYLDNLNSIYQSILGGVK